VYVQRSLYAEFW